jgi:Tfp pilus assembly protein PilN
MIKINLLPHKKVKAVEKGVQRLRMMIFALTAVVVLVLGYWSYILASEKSELAQKERQTSQQLEVLKKSVKEVAGFEKSRAELEQKLATIRELEKKKVPMTPLLNGLNALLPKEVWFTSLSVTGASFSVDGVARDNRTNAQSFVDRVAASPLFSDVQLVDVKEEPSQGVKKYSFKFTGRLAGYGQTQAPAPVAAAGAKPK